MNDIEARKLASAMNRPCPWCNVRAGKVCDRSILAEFEAFPVQIPAPWRWWSGPRWVHIHRERLI